eukprot:Lankesteria_metandrocarpae@DN5485_c0_g1_i23.p1
MVRNVVSKCKQKSAPGPDGITYSVYRQLRLEEALQQIYTKCVEHQKIPQSWKASKMILVYKKGDTTKVENFRPINLQNTVYKIYASYIARKIMGMAREHKLISGTQKGFMPCNGVHEHGFIGRAVINSAKRNKSQLYQVWYDLKNAFPSVSHNLIKEVLSSVNIPASIINIIHDIYDQSKLLLTVGSNTTVIDNNRGVKQGCPLSAILFNLCLEPLLRALDSAGPGIKLRSTETKLNHTAYADDLKVFCDSKEGITTLHKEVEDFLKWTNLEANPAKCATLGMKIQKGAWTADPADLKLHGQKVPAIGLDQSYNYLGVEDGPDRNSRIESVAQKIKEVSEQMEKLFTSKLQSWQKIKLCKSHLLTQLEFAMRNSSPTAAIYKKLDKHLRHLIKHSTRLPPSACTNFIYTAMDNGGLGFQSMAENLVVLQTAHALQMLTSPCNITRNVAISEILEVVKARNIRSAGTSDTDAILKYINGNAVRKRNIGDINSIWAQLPQNATRFQIELHYDNDNGRFYVQKTGIKMNTLNLVKKLHTYYNDKHMESWKNCADQGRNCNYNCQYSSTWMTAPHYITERQYNWAIKARLNLAPVKTVLARQKKVKEKKCRRCDQEETLAHVLCHCRHNTTAIRARHDFVLRRIVRAVRNGNPEADVIADQQPLEVNTQQRPDIIVIDRTKKTVRIADLTIAHADNNNKSLEQAATRKLEKYEHIAEKYRELGYQASVYAIVYSTLGHIHPDNLGALTCLGISRRYAVKMQEFIIKDTIRGSYFTWCRHVIN